jgi:hypothetical protein
MKNFLYYMLAIIIFPIAIVSGVLYGVLFVLELLCRTIMIVLDDGMSWVDRNITSNLK